MCNFLGNTTRMASSFSFRQSVTLDPLLTRDTNSVAQTCLPDTQDGSQTVILLLPIDNIKFKMRRMAVRTYNLSI